MGHEEGCRVGHEVEASMLKVQTGLRTLWGLAREGEDAHTHSAAQAPHAAHSAARRCPPSKVSSMSRSERFAVH